MDMKIIFVIILFLFSVCIYSQSDTAKSTLSHNPINAISKQPVKPYRDLFDPVLADGFDFPVGNTEGKGEYTDMTSGIKYTGWYIAVGKGVRYSLGIHPGEDWNGVGGGNTDLGQPVYSIGKGIVNYAGECYAPWGNVVILEHRYYENGQTDTVFSVYIHLKECYVGPGDTVEKREKIGSIGDGGGSYAAHLHFEVRKNSMRDKGPTFWPGTSWEDEIWVRDNYYDPTDFITNHRKMKIPADIEKLVQVVKRNFSMYYFEKGELKETYRIGLGGGGPERKNRQGDNLTPEGEYYVILKSQGPFTGTYSGFFGAGWIKLSYPNSFDAIRGYANGIITESQKNSIIAADKSGTGPPQGTKLGGGIGIHGWAGEWISDGDDYMTFGCVCMHNADMKELYTKVEQGMIIIIAP